MPGYKMPKRRPPAPIPHNRPRHHRHDIQEMGSTIEDPRTHLPRKDR
ncbi:hypothetical protein EYZ11_008293 [Aspergillus tanneri]|uniref:Uncharacterized protein n=1 Tax=Aspergillus tanneri TaxID=1220188 RepID=A0A4S3JB49_9EURO|nr:hypothetical protein EYZ11_008293 [Aspergillus tanneri]